MALKMLAEYTELLINQVKKYPELYDTKCKKYRDTFLKNRIYDDIAKEIGGNYTGQECKQRWKNLKDTYLKHLKGNFRPQNKPWTWINEMSFLEPYMYSQEKSKLLRKTNKEEEENDSEYEIEEEYLQVPDDSKSMYAINNDYSAQASTSSHPDPLQDDHNFEDKARHTQELVFHNNTSVHNFDDTDLIFLGYAKTVKKLKKKRQILTKFKIAQLLMNAELEDLPENNIVKRDHITSDD